MYIWEVYILFTFWSCVMAYILIYIYIFPQQLLLWKLSEGKQKPYIYQVLPVDLSPCQFVGAFQDEKDIAPGLLGALFRNEKSRSRLGV